MINFIPMLIGCTGSVLNTELYMLNRDFLVLILIALAIGIPLSYYLISLWLRNFVYRIEMHWWIFALTGFVFFLISMITISFQSSRAASMDPARSIRYE